MILILNHPKGSNYVLATIERNGYTNVEEVNFPELTPVDEDKMLVTALADVLQLQEEDWCTELVKMVRENHSAIEKEIEEWNEHNVYSEDNQAPEYDPGEESIEIPDEAEEN